VGLGILVPVMLAYLFMVAAKRRQRRRGGSAGSPIAIVAPFVLARHKDRFPAVGMGPWRWSVRRRP